MPLRAILWAAVSSETQAAFDKVSLPDQLALTRGEAEKLNAGVVASLIVSESRELLDFTTAASTVDAYKELRRLIDTKSADLLIFLNRGRLGRTSALVESLTLYCLRNGVALYDLSSKPNSLDAYSQLHNTGDQLAGIISSWRYQNELTEFRRRHDVGIKNRVKRGLFPNHIPYGWTRVFASDGTQSIVIDEQAAGAIRRIFELHVTGTSLSRIAEIVNSEGFTTYGKAKRQTSKAFNAHSVNRIIKKALLYAGYVQVNRVSKNRDLIIEKSQVIPAIISEALAQRVNAELGKRKHNGYTRGKHLFSGIVTCSICGTKMSVMARASRGVSPNGKRYIYSIVKCPGGCKRNLAFGKLRSALIKFFDSLQHTTLIVSVDNVASELRADIEKVQAQLAAIPEAKARAYSAFVDGLADRDAYQNELKRLDTRKAELQQHIQAIEVQLSGIDNSEERIERFNHVREVGRSMVEYSSTDPAAVNQWLRSYIRIEFDQERNINIFAT